MKERFGNWSRRNRAGPASSELDLGIAAERCRGQSPFAYLGFSFYFLFTLWCWEAPPTQTLTTPTGRKLKIPGGTLGTKAPTSLLPIANLIPVTEDTLGKPQTPHDSMIQWALSLKVCSKADQPKNYLPPLTLNAYFRALPRTSLGY